MPRMSVSVRASECFSCDTQEQVEGISVQGLPEHLQSLYRNGLSTTTDGPITSGTVDPRRVERQTFRYAGERIGLELCHRSAIAT